MTDSDLVRTLAKLPAHLRAEVADFAAFLLERHANAQRAETGERHPLSDVVGAWAEESLSDDELLPERTVGRPVDL